MVYFRAYFHNDAKMPENCKMINVAIECVKESTSLIFD